MRDVGIHNNVAEYAHLDMEGDREREMIKGVSQTADIPH